MFFTFFIRRPVFAGVCSFIILLAGAVTIPTLPIALYPNIVPPQVTVTSRYVGASAETVETTVTTPIEQQVNGVEGMKYLQSTSGADGSSVVTVTFDLERNIDAALVDVQNRVATAQARLPNEVRSTGVTVAKSSPAIVMAMGLYDKNNQYSNLFISNYADVYIKDALKRVKGVGDVRIFGERKYSMRLWLDPNKLASRDLTAMDVVTALESQNLQVAAGQVGQQPAAPGQMFQIGLQARGRLVEPSEFGQIIVKAANDGTLVKVADVGRAELGAEDYNSFLRFNSREDAVGIGIYQLPNANALDVEQGVRAELARLEHDFPPGLTYEIAFNPTEIVSASIEEVVVTLLEALALVVLVVFLFLQEWRSTLIPALTIPVSLVGTFVFVQFLGFSINTLTLFGITLATGLVVDDAIVVIENIARFIETKGMKPREAASGAMAEVAGAVVATSLVLVSVFIPVAFFPGTTGQLYKQFALTIACSITLSLFGSLTLTPALSALLLKHEKGEPNIVFRWFNRGLDAVRRGFRWTLELLMGFKTIALAGFVVFAFLTYWLVQIVPTGFVPDEDQGYFIIAVQGPEGASLEYTTNVIKEIEAQLSQIPEINGVFAIGGFGFTGNAPNKATIFPALKPFSERKRADQSAGALMNKLRGSFGSIKDATVVVFGPPAVQGLGNSSGFQFEVLDHGGNDLETLARVSADTVGKGNASPTLRAVYTAFSANAPQLLVDVNRERAEALHVPVSAVFETLQIYFASQYVNDFTFNTRPYRVYVQADSVSRANPTDLDKLYVRSATGEMVPLGNVITVKDLVSPQTIPHFNLYRSAEINGVAAPGYSSGQALDAIVAISHETLPSSFGYDLAGIAREQREAGSAAVLLFALGILFVYLILAAQYESFTDPAIVLLAVPLAIFGGLFAQWVRGLPNDVYCQVGLVMLIGLASKNAILIVEFANQLREADPERSAADAVIEAAETRLRPILMTSFAFILGITPLVLATGAGSGARKSLGTVVFGGMLVSTVLNLFLIPVLYAVIGGLRECSASMRAGVAFPMGRYEVAFRRFFATAQDGVENCREILGQMRAKQAARQATDVADEDADSGSKD